MPEPAIAYQVVVSAMTNGDLRITAPPGIPPVVLVGLLEVAKSLTLKDQLSPKDTPSIIPGTPDMLNRMNGTPPTG